MARRPRIEGEALAPLDPAQVEAFLEAHPRFLAEHGRLYEVLEPPRRVHGEGLADHMAAMIAAERARAGQLRAAADAVVEASRANAAIAARVRRAVVALARGADRASVLDTITHELPALLGLEVVSVAAEDHDEAGLRRLPHGAVSRLLAEEREVLLRPETEGDAMLHGEAASLVASDALVRLPQSWGGGPALLICGAREAGTYQPGQAGDLLQFLAETVAACLARTRAA